MFKMEIDTSALIANLSDLEKKQLPFATMLALNDSMFDVRDAWKEAMPRVFDQPTQLTRNAVLYKKATKDNLVAEVYLRNEATKGTPPSRYLIHQAEGGERQPKPFEFLLRNAGVIASDEFLIPARGFPLDQFGNVPPGIVRKIITDLQSSRDPQTNASAASRRRRERSRAVSKRALYFVSHGPSGNRGDNRPQHLPRGIYERVGFASGSSIRMVFAIVKGAPRYSRRFDARKLAQDAFNASFPNRFRQRMTQAVRTARV